MADGFAHERNQPTSSPAKAAAVPKPVKKLKVSDSKKAIPQTVANRMARRVAIATGIPTIMGMAVFVGSYLLITKKILDIPTGITLISSGGCFLLGLVGLSYGIFSSSWLEEPGSLFGFEQIKPNIKRLRSGASSPEKQQR